MHQKSPENPGRDRMRVDAFANPSRDREGANAVANPSRSCGERSSREGAVFVHDTGPLPYGRGSGKVFSRAIRNQWVYAAPREDVV